VGCLLQSANRCEDATRKEIEEQVMYVHLIDSDGTWVAQFANAEVCVRWVAEQGWDINNYSLEMGPSKYPSS
jgi:hypothetical protein